MATSRYKPGWIVVAKTLLLLHGLFGHLVLALGFIKRTTELVDIKKTILNDNTQQDQEDVAIAALPDGGFVVVWESLGEVDAEDVVIARFNAELVKIGQDVVVNTVTNDNQDDPDVAVLSNGNILVVYEAFDAADGEDVKGQIFDINLNKIGNEILIEGGQNEEVEPTVSAIDNGNFVVTWSENNEIFGRLLDSQGALLGNEKFKVSQTINDPERNPDVTSLAEAGFVVVWEREINAGDTDIYGQRFNSNGEQQGPEFLVNTFQTGNQLFPAVDRLGTGFVVGWESFDQVEANDIFIQRFDANGNKRGEETLVNAITGGDQQDVFVFEITKGFAVAWEDEEEKVVFQRFDSDGKKVDVEVEIEVQGPVRDVAGVQLQNGNIVAPFEQVIDGSEDIVGALLIFEEENNVALVSSLFTVAGVLIVGGAFILYKRNKRRQQASIHEQYRVNRIEKENISLLNRISSSFHVWFSRKYTATSDPPFDSFTSNGNPRRNYTDYGVPTAQIPSLPSPRAVHIDIPKRVSEFTY